MCCVYVHYTHSIIGTLVHHLKTTFKLLSTVGLLKVDDDFPALLAGNYKDRN